MATIKSYTDIKQSETLVKLLPPESADAKYGYIAPYDYSDRMYDGGYDEIPYPNAFLKKDYSGFFADEYDGELPCWSLSALLDILPKYIGDYRKYLYYDAGEYHCGYIGNGDVMFTLEETKADNPIDACYEMIIKLDEQNLI